MKATRTCELDGCDRDLEARGLCHAHYVRMNRTGKRPTDGSLQLKGLHPACTVNGCDRKHYANGYCKAHNERVAMNGTPGSADLSRHVSDRYITVHQRIYDKRGKASTYSCVDCSGPALDWSYNHSGIEEITRAETRGSKTFRLTFSTDISQYEPRCRRCHYAFDAREREQA